jgi:leader peptidase (prepilin peptidase)/N-methyltransferase
VIPVALTLVATLGLAIGSFLNVVTYRVPAGMSVVAPRSACPNCKTEISARDNVPLASWLLLRGKCRTCSEPISMRYPLVELGGGVAFVIVALFFGPAVFAATDVPAAFAASLQLVAFLYLAAISIALALIDLDVHKLPNAIVLPAYAVGAILLGASAILSGDLVGLGRAAIGAAVSFAFYFVLALVKPGGMGFGDVKLAGVLGLYLAFVGWDALVVGMASAFVLGGVFGVALLVSRRATRGTGIPFGPWMLAGAWVGILAGGQLTSAYLSLTGLN